MADPSVVHLVDRDQDACRQWMRVLARAGYEVRSFASPTLFLAHGLPLRPGCVVAEITHDTFTGLELQSRVREIDPTVSIVFASADADVRKIVRVMRAGAIDFLEKPVSDAALTDAVDRAIQRCADMRARELQRSSAQERFGRLTPRERTILEHVLQGQLNKQIAAVLDCQEATVKVHRSRLMRKLGVRSIARLVQFAHDFGIGQPSLAGNAHRDHGSHTGLHAG